MMTCRPMETWARTVPISPALGVIPPSIKSLHNSMRAAPPCCAATADATESTQTSMRAGLVMGLVTGLVTEFPEQLQSIYSRNAAATILAHGCIVVAFQAAHGQGR